MHSIHTIKYISVIFIALIILFSKVSGQTTYPVHGIKDERPSVYVFVNANIVPSPGNLIESGTLIIENGYITAVGSGLQIPEGAIVRDLNGNYIYPSFIDLYTNYGLKEAEKDERERRQQLEPDRKGAYTWNDALKIDFNAFENFTHNEQKAALYRNAGFGILLSHQMDGIARGSSALVLLNGTKENELIIKDEAATFYSFEKGTSTQNYPSSMMGSIALLKQTFLDARWYAEGGSKKEFNIGLKRWNELDQLPQLFESDDVLTSLRAIKIAKEFNTTFIIKGSGNEYQRLDEITKTGAAFIIPLDFPDAYDVEDPFDANEISLAQLKHWELAPFNPFYLEKNEIPFAFTSFGLKNANEIIHKIQIAIDAGLSKETALKALTITPANFINISDVAGSIEKGKMANFIICSGEIFEKGTSIYENWNKGIPFVINDMNIPDLRGTWNLEIDGKTEFEIKVSSKGKKTSAQLRLTDKTTVNVNITYENQFLLLTFNIKDHNELPAGMVRLSALYNKSETSSIISGHGKLADGKDILWTAQKTSEYSKNDTVNEEKAVQIRLRDPADIIYPFASYGNAQKPERKTYLIKNIRVWTNEEAGVLENHDVLIENGRISRIGTGLEQRGAILIDGTGKHLTPGIIDEHAHIAISGGVNEGTHAITAEVRIGDVINSEDINIYRHLSGGVTTIQLLHGSANPIGGQAQLIKMRWGAAPEELKFENAPNFIKFALGENVKQSNWGQNFSSRYPQTRMGVEQIIFEVFYRALHYKEEFENFNKLSRRAKLRTTPPRKDLMLETLVEILNNERFISCHSYTQSEINMLMKLADSMGFKINTFTHIIEGYKVADKMKEHGAGASSFSDWWNIKYELKDGIPQNPALLHQVGVITAVNSDNAEVARRLNHEAAKSVKYAGLSQEEALKLVTLNPAILLRVDDKVGSIKTGKHADIVIWSDNPLSVFAKVEKTFVDGILYFDLENDKKLREETRNEINRLINKMLEAKSNGAKTKAVEKVEEHDYHCDDIH